MTAINKIIEEKVRARLCRALPPPLQNYLKIIVKIPKPHSHGGDASAENLLLPQSKKTREVVDDHPDAEQTDFLFYKEDNETPEMKRRQINYKMKIVRSLLDDYLKMSDRCKVKMRFVRDYLEKNLAILQNLYDKCVEDETTYKDQEVQQPEKVKKKHTAHPKGHKTNKGSERSIDEQLEKVGWENRKNKLLTEEDVEKIVRQSLGKGKRETKDGRVGSAQYRTLVQAVEKARKKQEKEEKLGQLFGEKRSLRNENYETIRSSNKEAQDFGHFNFEEPLVFNMDN